MIPIENNFQQKNSLEDVDYDLVSPYPLKKKWLIKSKKYSIYDDYEFNTSKDDHPNIIKLYEIYENEDKIYYVMEYCDGSELFEEIESQGKLNENDAKEIFVQIISAIHYCHLRGVIHRKGDKKSLKLIDFGISKFYTISKISSAGIGNKQKMEMTTQAGTPYYIAPEVINGNYDEKCDIWSAGIILYVMLCGYPPFLGDNELEIFRSILLGDFDFEGPGWQSVSEEVKELINKMLCPAYIRISSTEILGNSWLNLKNRKKSGDIFSVDEKNIKRFAVANKLKKLVLIFIVSQLSEEEVEPYRNLFLNLDKKNSGSINFRAFLKILPENLKNNEEKAEKLFNCIDLNKNGTLDYIEFLTACLDSKKYINEKRLKNAFQIFDVQDIGNFGIMEIKATFGNCDDMYWQKCINEVDIDKDGVINYNDFLFMMN